MEFKTIPLTFAKIRIGMYIQDSDGDHGYVKKCEDWHNILVELKSRTGGYAFYCLDPSCKEYENLYEIETSNIPTEKIIVCKCGASSFIYRDGQLCYMCHEILQ